MQKNLKKSDLLDMSIIELIYKEREDTLYKYNSQDKENINKITDKNTVSYDDLITAIKNLPPHFGNTREFILERLEKFLEEQNSLCAYDNRKFYKNGFCDGARMMLEILENKK